MFHSFFFFTSFVPEYNILEYLSEISDSLSFILFSLLRASTECLSEFFNV
jgi:hypothetical protein